MKFLVSFKFRADLVYPYIAEAEVDGEKILGLGHSYSEAESELRKKLQKYQDREECPQPKEVEI